MPSSYGDDLADVVSKAIGRLTVRNRSREQALPISREVIRFSANAIRAVHRGDLDEADKLIAQGRGRSAKTTPRFTPPLSCPTLARNSPRPT